MADRKASEYAVLIIPLKVCVFHLYNNQSANSARGDRRRAVMIVPTDNAGLQMLSPRAQEGVASPRTSGVVTPSSSTRRASTRGSMNLNNTPRNRSDSFAAAMKSHVAVASTSIDVWSPSPK